jgi:hypothetical protein
MVLATSTPFAVSTPHSLPRLQRGVLSVPGAQEQGTSGGAGPAFPADRTERIARLGALMGNGARS